MEKANQISNQFLGQREAMSVSISMPELLSKYWAFIVALICTIITLTTVINSTQNNTDAIVAIVTDQKIWREKQELQMQQIAIEQAKMKIILERIDKKIN